MIDFEKMLIFDKMDMRASLLGGIKTNEASVPDSCDQQSIQCKLLSYGTSASSWNILKRMFSMFVPCSVCKCGLSQN